MKRWAWVFAGFCTLMSLAVYDGVVVAATPSSAWTLYHRHQAMVEHYEAMHHGKSPLPVDETEHHPDYLRP